jgi:hypothetical protein
MDLVERINATMPSFAPAEEATEIKARWIAVSALVAGFLLGGVLLWPSLLVIMAGQRLGAWL